MMRKPKFHAVKPIASRNLKRKFSGLKDDMDLVVHSWGPMLYYYWDALKRKTLIVLPHLPWLLCLTVLVVGLILIEAKHKPAMPPDEMTGRLLNLLNMCGIVLLIFGWDVILYSHKVPLFR